MSLINSLTVVDVIERERKDGTGTFPVVILRGISFNKGNFTVREVSSVINGISTSQARQLFPKGSKLNGWGIKAVKVDPYTFEVLDSTTGEMVTVSSDVRYEAVNLNDIASQEPAPVAQSTVESTPAPKNVEVGAPEQE